MRVIIDQVTELTLGVYEGEVTPSEVRTLGPCNSVAGQKSILCFHSSYRFYDGRLSFKPKDVSILNIGKSNKALFVNLSNNNNAEFTEPGSTIEIIKLQEKDRLKKFKVGDKKFLISISHYLNEDLAELGKQLLLNIRREFPGDLVQGKARKWVNSPDNFFAITIQHKDRSYAVHVKGKREDFNTKTLDIRPDRSSYLRFKISDWSQLEEAISVILKSGHIHGYFYPK